MLRGAFSFQGRIGRLDFFLAGLVFALGAIVAALGIWGLATVLPKGSARVVVVAVLVVALLVVAFWYSLSLHVRRIRDIGWSPLVIILGWIVFQLADSVVAALYPWLATGRPAHTIVGVLGNTGLGLILLFMPGRDGAPPRYEARGQGPGRDLERDAPLAVAALSRPAPVGFGRRGLR